ncbi:MAG TPA: AAA family ATPase [Ramlibacter sp.]|nr:AAA family ATPase [Ramlibacter sp.]
MYLRHFGLRELPFSITPDTSFFFSSGGSQEALNTLLIAARTGEGFIKITGEVGTGKTLLCRKLMAQLGPEFFVAYIPNPYLDPAALFMELGCELGLEFEPGSNLNRHELLKAVSNRLVELASEGKHVVICLDEAQAMPIESLEALRLLTNLETEKRKLLQVIIFGQPELDFKLNHASVRQLKQRIAFDYRLGPMTSTEINYYLQHRMVIAGYQGGQLFDAVGIWLLKRRTGRIPRLVNIVAHKSLLSAFGKGKRRVGFFDVLAACRDTSSLDRGTPANPVRVLMGAILIAGCIAAFTTWMNNL